MKLMIPKYEASAHDIIGSCDTDWHNMLNASGNLCYKWKSTADGIYDVKGFIEMCIVRRLVGG